MSEIEVIEKVVKIEKRQKEEHEFHAGLIAWMGETAEGRKFVIQAGSVPIAGIEVITEDGIYCIRLSELLNLAGL